MGSNVKPANRRGLLALAGTLVLTIATVLGVTAASADTTPSVSLAPPSSASYTSAHLSGMVNPNGGPSTTEWHFEYSPTGEEGSYAWGPAGELSGPEAEGNSPVAVEGELTGLSPGAFYYVRLVATNEFGNNRAAASTYLFTESISSPSVSIDAPSSISSSGAHFGGQINPEGTDPAFAIDWRFDCTPACPGLEGSIPAGTTPQTVEADATGLLPGTEYKVSLVAKNAGEAVSAGPESFATEAIGPQVEGQSASPASTEATLSAQLNPGGAQTSYFFHYGPTAAYGQSTAPKLTSGGTTKAVSDSIAGLAPGTTYHYRLVAENSEGKAEGPDRTFTTLAQQGKGSCPNEAFRTGAAAQLPDCRAYEMVSPSFKNGTDVAGVRRTYQSSPTRSSTNGDRVVVTSEGSFSGNGSNFLFTSYLGTRSLTGWATEGISPVTSYPRQLGATAFAMQAFSPDLRYSIFSKINPPLTADAMPNTMHLYRRDNLTGAIVNLTPVGVPEEESTEKGPIFSAATNDFAHVIFESKAALAPGAVDGVPNLYEWTGGETRLVAILPNGDAAPEGSVAGPIYPGFLGGAGGKSYLETAISDDGSRIVWSDLATKQIYLRIDGVNTERVSASQRTNDSGPGGADPLGPQPAIWQHSNPDGSIVYFKSTEKLTNDSTASAVDAGKPDLYAYHVDSGQLEDLSVSSEPGTSANVQGMLGASDDGEYVYFAATGALAPGAVVEPGRANVYLWHAGETRYITTLGGADDNTFESDNWVNNSFTRVKPSRVTGDGRVAIFRSKEKLTPYDSNGFLQLYRYDAAADSLTCMSCSSLSPASTSEATNFAGVGSGPSFGSFREQVLSADGSRAYFNTRQALVPQDTNNQIDVYQWGNGKLSLISSGQSSDPSYFGDASASGDDVYFVTRERLSPADTDDNVDLYDARVNGGFTLAAGTGNCQGEDCQPASANPPLATTPGSGAVGGQGNAKPRRNKKARCAKPRKAKKAKASVATKRCTPKKAAKKKRANAKKQGGAK